MKFDAVHINSAPEILVKEVINQIQSGSLKPGDVLPSQRALAKMFQVGLGSVREAIKILNVMGYVNVIRGKGTYISMTALDMDLNSPQLEKVFEAISLADLMEAREIIECEAARIAAHVREKEALTHLKEIDNRMERSLYERVSMPNTLSSLLVGRPMSEYRSARGAYADTDFFFKIDFKFHMAVAEASHNKAIIQLVKLLVDQAHEHTELMDSSLGISTPFNIHAAVKTAREVIAAIEQRDTDLARDRMQAHLNIVNVNLKNEFPQARSTPMQPPPHLRSDRA